MRALVLGHTGFLGRALMAGARERDWAVDGVSTAELDLTAKGAVSRLADRLDGETSLIMAASIRREHGDTTQTEDTIVQMAASVAEAILSRSPRWVGFISSVSVYGETRGEPLVTEATPTRPHQPYGKAKLESERRLSGACETAGVPLAVLRPCRIYGPGDRAASYGPSRFVYDALTTGAITLFGHGLEVRDHIFVDDVARAVLALAERRWQGVANISRNEHLSFRRIAEFVEGQCEPLGYQVDIVQRPRSGEAYDQDIGSFCLASAIPEWRATPMGEGIARCIRAAMAEGATTCVK